MSLRNRIAERRGRQNKVKFGEKVVTNKIIVHLSQKVCRLPSPPALLHKFTNMHTEEAIESVQISVLSELN